MSDPATSSHFHPSPVIPNVDPARWLSRRSSSPHPSLPIHQSFHIRYHSEDKVPNPSPVPPPFIQTVQLLFPSNKQRIREVVKKQHRHMILQHLCIGLSPWITHHLQPSTLEGARTWGLRGVSGHHLAGEDIPKIGAGSNGMRENIPASWSASSPSEVWCTEQSTHSALLGSTRQLLSETPSSSILWN